MFSEGCAPIFYKIMAAGRVMACLSGRASLVHFRDFGSQNGNRLVGRSLIDGHTTRSRMPYLGKHTRVLCEYRGVEMKRLITFYSDLARCGSF